MIQVSLRSRAVNLGPSVIPFSAQQGRTKGGVRENPVMKAGLSCNYILIFTTITHCLTVFILLPFQYDEHVTKWLPPAESSHILKVSKFQKQNIMFYPHAKNKQNVCLNLPYRSYGRIRQIFCLFFWMMGI